MLYLENGTSWSGTGITGRIKTGDFFPSSNIWDETTIRKFKLLTHKFTDVADSDSLEIYYYKNTEEIDGAGVAFVSSDDGVTGACVLFVESSPRIETGLLNVLSKPPQSSLYPRDRLCE